MFSKLVILVLGVTLLFMCGYLVYSRATGNDFLKKSDAENLPKEEIVIGNIGQPLDRALLSITFDDGHDSQIKNALPLLEKNKFPATFYISTGLLGKPGYMNDDQIKQLVAGGHHIGAHTISHPHLPTLSDADQEKELSESQKYLKEKFGVGAQDFASPYGDVNDQVMQKVIARYRSHRNVLPGFNYRDNFDAYGVGVQNVLLTTTEADVRAWIDAAIANKSWLVLVYHQIDNGGDAYSATPENFEKHIDTIAKSEINVVTFDKAFDEISPQTSK